MSQSIKRLGLVLLAFTLLSVLGCGPNAEPQSAGQYMDDTVITSKVKAAIFADPNLKTTEISVETHQGHVQLHGSAKSQSDIDNVVQIARAVEGVTEVKSDMALKQE